MTQTRKHSAIEAAANIGAGILLQYMLGMGLIRAMGYPITPGQNVIVTAVMTVASFARQYGIRRAFNGWRV